MTENMTEPGTFQKNPASLQAIRWSGDNHKAIREFTGKQSAPGGEDFYVFRVNTTNGAAELYVNANNAWLDLEVGEWILKDSAGFYPCKDKIFHENYAVKGQTAVPISNDTPGDVNDKLLAILEHNGFLTEDAVKVLREIYEAGIVFRETNVR